MPEFLRADDLATFTGVLIDCRFALGDVGAGRRDYAQGHIPQAHYLDLAEDLSGSLGEHGGRHPLPTPQSFAKTLAALGVGVETDVVVYDDSRFVFAARCWWMMRALGYKEPRLLNGGYSAWVAKGGVPETRSPSRQAVDTVPVSTLWPGCCDKEELARLQSQSALLVDAREPARYRGEHEPIDPIAGHIPGAINLPWQSFSTDGGFFLEASALKALWADNLEARPLVLYCGSGVSACVNVLSLAVLEREDVWLYGGSWSDWCSYL